MSYECRTFDGMTHPTQPLHVHLQELVGKGTIRFLAVIPHGKGTREVAVEVPPDLILRLADALRATRGSACNTANSRIADPTDDGYHVGHAVWHVEHPVDPMPCIDHSKVIDMQALPAGPQICMECQGPIDKDGECRCEECATCLGVGRLRDGETRDLRKCLDCNGEGMHITGPAARSA
jgi:hypothetical protein